VAFEVPRKAGPEGSKTGIGLTFEKRSWEPYFRITGVPADGTAHAAGVKVDDFLVEVNGEDVAELAAKDVTSRILGEPGSIVSLKTLEPTQEYHKPEAVDEPLTMPLAEGVDNTAHAVPVQREVVEPDKEDLPIPDEAEEERTVRTKVFGEGDGPLLKVPKDNVVDNSAADGDVQGPFDQNGTTEAAGDNPLKPLANLFGADDVELNPLDPFAAQVRKNPGSMTEDDEPDPMDTEVGSCSIM